MNSADKKRLRAKAHKLKPVVMLGQSGLTDSVLAEIILALETHELIKIKILSDDRDLRKELSGEICLKCEADLIQNMGKVLTVYKKRPE